MSDRVLLTRDLNRALLARQFLLERSPVPLTRALESLAGLQTQYAPSAYIGLWSRLRDFRRGAVTEALEQQGAVQATLMRGTIHTVSAEDFPLFAASQRRPPPVVAPRPAAPGRRPGHGGGGKSAARAARARPMPCQ